MSGQFRYSVWDPILVISQIATIQAFFYTSLGFLILTIDTLTGNPTSLSHIFSYNEIGFKTGHGRLVVFSYLVNSLFGSLALWYFVQRAKPCLDFSITTHLIHLVLSWLYNGHFPNTFSWWILNVICVAMMCVCGEFLCMKTELKAIPLTLSQKSDV